MRFLRIIWMTGIIVLLVSCKNFTMYHSYHHLPHSGWGKGDTVDLHLQITDTTSGFYKFEFLVRNQTNFKYQDLRLVVDHNFPDSLIWRTDTLLFNISDVKGNWLGKGISGLYETIIPFDTTTTYYPREYTFRITPVTEDTLLMGVYDIGVIAKKQ